MMENTRYVIPVDKSDNEDGRRRILSVNGVETGARFASLSFVDNSDGDYKIPLGKLDSCELKKEKTEWDTVLVPVYPMLYATLHTSEKANRAHAIPTRPGWIYIYKNGYLWREIQVLERSFYRDVNLTVYQGLDIRYANVQRDNRILIPHKVNGEKQDIQICFSEVQWGWEYINKMGGMDPKDPRLLDGTPLPDGNKSEATSVRDKRMGKIIDLSSYKQNFKVDTGPIGPIDETKCWSAKIQHGTVIPALYLHDPIGIARALKEDHAASGLELEMLSQAMQDSEYPLALLLKDLLDACQKRLGEASRNSEDYESLLEYELFNSVKIGKVAETIEKWQELDMLLTEQVYKDGKRALDYIVDDAQPISFHTALLDYFQENLPQRFTDGAAVWLGMIELFYFKEARQYIKDVINGKWEIGKYLTEPTEEQAKYTIELEQNSSLDEGLYPLIVISSSDPVRAAKYSTKIFRYMVNGFALAKLDEPGTAGLEWLIKFIQKYIPEFKAAVVNTSIDALYTANGMPSAHLYRYFPVMTDANVKATKFQVPVIVPEGIDLPKSAKQIKSHWLYRKGFMGLWGTLETINGAMAVAKAWDQPDTRNVTKAFIAAADMGGFLATITDMATEGKRARVEVKKEQADRLLRNSRTRARKIPTRSTWVRDRRLANLTRSLSLKQATLEFAGKSSRFLGLASAAGNTLVGAWDIYQQVSNKNYAGAVGGSINMAGGLMTFVGTYQFNRWSKIRKAMQVAKAVRNAGAAATATVAGAPEGLLMIIAGSIALTVGEIVLQSSLQPSLLKAVKYGYFGKEAYNGLYTPYDRPDVIGYVDHSVYKKGLFGAEYTEKMDLELIYAEPEDFDTELGEIYRCLYEYTAGVGVYKQINRNKRSVTGKQVIKGSIYFSRVLPKKTAFEIEFELHYADQLEKPVIRLDEMLIREEVEEGNLKALHVYYETKKKGISEVIMRSMMDIQGDARFMVPGGGGEATDKLKAKKFTKKESKFKPIYGAQGFINYPYPTKNATSLRYTISEYDMLDTIETHQPYRPQTQPLET